MDWKLFLSTFGLIFIAELGDKTQLAAMARAAGGEGRVWTVFAAASLALVFSTLVAVTLGGELTRFVPETYIQLVAGILFLLFGALILYGVLAPAKEPEPTSGAAGPVTRLVLELAAEFEEAAGDDYRALAASAASAELKALLLSLAADEDRHLARVRGATATGEGLETAHPAAAALPERADLLHDVAALDRPVIVHALEHERATAAFYHELARTTPLPTLGAIFAGLAREEDDHVRQLEAFLHKDGPGASPPPPPA